MVQVNVKGVSLSHVVGEATKGRQSPRPLESGLAAGAALLNCRLNVKTQVNTQLENNS
ncbi:hypothetical protein [Pseudomonas graminis]